MAWTRHGHPATRQPGQAGKFAIFSEVALNDSNKTFTVGGDCEEGLVHLQRIRIEYTATATVGTRGIGFSLESESGDVLASMTLASNDQPAASDVSIVELSEVGIRYGPVAPGNETRDYLLANLVATTGMVFRVWDANAIDASADDMIVHLAMEMKE